MVRLKFRVSQHSQQLDYKGRKVGSVKLFPVSDNDPNSENGKFYDATPSGSFEFGTVNEEALHQLPLGAEVYINIEIAKPE